MAGWIVLLACMVLQACASQPQYPDICYRTIVQVNTTTDMITDFETFPCKRERTSYHWEPKP